MASIPVTEPTTGAEVDETHEEHTGHGGHHVLSFRMLLGTFLALVGLTIFTVILALLERGFVAADTFGIDFDLGFHVPFGALSVPIALAIAGVKAYLVSAYFMGLKYDRGSNLLVYVLSGVFLIVFLGITFLDVGFRDVYDDLSAVPVDILDAEAQALEAQDERIREAFEAAPLVGAPDSLLFGRAPGAPGVLADGTEEGTSGAVADSTQGGPGVGPDAANAAPGPASGEAPDVANVD